MVRCASPRPARIREAQEDPHHRRLQELYQKQCNDVYALAQIQ